MSNIVKKKRVMCMKKYNKLTPFPLGAIQPRGWMLEQLRRNKEGMGGKLPELERRMKYAQQREKELCGSRKLLADAMTGYEFFGLHRRKNGSWRG